MADEHGVAGGSHDHAEHGQPDVRHALWRLSSVPNAQHVAHGLEDGKRIELTPRVILQGDTETEKQVTFRVKAKFPALVSPYFLYFDFCAKMVLTQ